MTSNVLILSAGRRVSLVKAFQQAMIDLNLNSQVICADMNPTRAAACHIADSQITLPHCLADNYISSLLSHCIAHNIAMVIPTIDTELKTLAHHKAMFAEKGITLVVSDIKLVTQCRDKRLTNALFREIGFPVPECYSLTEIKFPCFAKPISGSLSQDIRILASQNELDTWNVDHNAMMFMEIVPYTEFDEFTIDIYFDSSGQLKCIVPRQRLEVRGGEVSKALTVKSLVTLIKPVMEKIQGAFGCLTLQVFKHKSTDALFGIEINPRFGGGFPLSNLAGAKYPQWLIEDVILNQNRAYFDEWKDQLMMLRFDGEVIVDCT